MPEMEQIGLGAGGLETLRLELSVRSERPPGHTAVEDGGGDIGTTDRRLRTRYQAGGVGCMDSSMNWLESMATKPDREFALLACVRGDGDMIQVDISRYLQVVECIFYSIMQSGNDLESGTYKTPSNALASITGATNPEAIIRVAGAPIHLSRILIRGSRT